MQRATASLKYTLPHSIVGDGEVMRIGAETLRKALLASLIAALVVVAAVIAYPVAAWALSMGRHTATSSREGYVETSTLVAGDIEEMLETLGKHVVVYTEKEHGMRGYMGQGLPGFPKTVLSAVFNVSSSSGVVSVSEGDKVGLVLTKKGGNYSLLILIYKVVSEESRARGKVYQVVTNDTDVLIYSDNITITGKIARSSLADLAPGSPIEVIVQIGSASISSDGKTISGNILGLIFKK